MLKASTLSIVLLATYAQSSAQTAKAPLLSDDDKVAIIRTALDVWRSRAEKLPPAEGAHLLKIHILSTEGISSTILFKLSDLNLTFLNAKQIKKLGRREKGVAYLLVGEIKGTEDYVAMTLSASAHDRIGGLFAHTYYYSFKKVDGRWEGKICIIVC